MYNSHIVVSVPDSHPKSVRINDVSSDKDGVLGFLPIDILSHHILTEEQNQCYWQAT